MEARVIELEDEGLIFDNGFKIYSEHVSDCCEHHYLSTSDLTLKDFDGLEFDLTNDKFFKRIPGYGIELIPIKGHSVKIPGYGDNNGYYGDYIDLVVKGEGYEKIYDITECQDYYED